MADAGRHAFVAGFPIRHSRSPLIHGTWLKRLGIAGSYDAVEISPDNFEAFVGALKDGSAGFVGGNVTIPHKERAFALADSADDLATELGAANTLWLEEGALCAANTDGYGFIANLDQKHPGWDADKDTAIVLGAGGASRAVILALRERGFSAVHVVNRTVARANELADRFGPHVHGHGMDALPDLLAGASFFVNTTSLGMDGTEAPAIDFTVMKSGATVSDIVYVPLETPFLAMARAQGLATVDGLGMLLHQAVPGFERWFGVRPEVDEALRALVITDIEAH